MCWQSKHVLVELILHINEHIKYTNCSNDLISDLCNVLFIMSALTFKEKTKRQKPQTNELRPRVCLELLSLSLEKV